MNSSNIQLQNKHKLAQKGALPTSWNEYGKNMDKINKDWFKGTCLKQSWKTVELV